MFNMKLALFLLQILLYLHAQLVCGRTSDSAEPDYVLVATAQDLNINCQTRYSVVLNGTSPGPPLYMKEGQSTWIRVFNHIKDENVTVHWHGLSQRTSPFSDGTPLVSQWPIAPNNFFDYIVTPQVGDAGSYFYHSHVGFQANTAHGVIIVQDKDEPPYQYDEDLPLFIQDYFPRNDSAIQAGLLANPFKWSGEAESIQINGFSGNSSFKNASDATCTPLVIPLSPGSIYRLRFISGTSLSLVTLGIEDHDNLTIIEADGEYTMPWETDHVQLGSGQRFSVLIKAKSIDELREANKTMFWLRYENRDRPANTSGYALLQYKVDDMSLPDEVPDELPDEPPVHLPSNVTDWSEYSLEALAPTERFPTLDEVTRTVTITMRQVIREGAYTNKTINGTLEWAQDDLVWQTESRETNNSLPYLIQVYLTGQVPNYTAALENGGWDPYTHAFPALPGEVLDIVWESNSGPTGGWDFHPMHAHGKHYFDLGSGNGTYNATENEKHFEDYTPARRDTTLLHRYAVSGEPGHTAGWRAWRIRVTEDDVGAWMMHCHILQHMIMGLYTPPSNLSCYALGFTCQRVDF
ncbi:hypothetical protein B0A52_07439 [Exophiala mesophila]|uniref:L-ascorbate oxidase n=1 Tax=Exophiala mesophila TaxID=212818 RepID=A0A438MXF5_EXOME|nr:hypothetical protein B0A52_07439 [Exophiala mesophila]